MESFSNVWDALELNPDEAAAWRLRSDLVLAIRATIDGWGFPPAQAAPRLAMEEREVEDLFQGRIDRLTLDRLVTVAHRAGIAIRVEGVEAAA